MHQQAICRPVWAPRNADPDTPDAAYGQTPLLWAAENGREIVKLLLRRKDASLDSSSTVYPAEHCLVGCENCHEGIVRLPLG